MEKVSQFIARVFLGHIFVLAGLSKIGAYEGTQGYMDAMGVPGMLLPLVILLKNWRGSDHHCRMANTLGCYRAGSIFGNLCCHIP